ncbi:putative carbonic anhydrase 3 isoform X2 [Aricia agestis]|uniref:putative carbonic anhydrase 3 isoform X2 n=1 Tax=Aricia agestis TaxID=91739 RepID=UPI001C20AEBC|nr:putative carbonic anhydrase 3 isoform X2 [Aricia agestis]
MQIKVNIGIGAEDTEKEPQKEEEDKSEPEFGSVEWLYRISDTERNLPSPIDVSITGSTVYSCPELSWYNFDVYPHKIKITNTGYTQRPYLEGGPLLEKHILSQIHFHWGENMMEGTDHTVDKIRHPVEMQVTFFKSEYLTQDEAFRHPDGTVVICYIIQYGANPDDRLTWVTNALPKVCEAKTSTRVGPYPMSTLLPMFTADYFFYWGSLSTAKGDYVARWIVPRTNMSASFEQITEFRKLMDPWDEPLKKNFRTLQERGDRHLFFINPRWSQHNSLLPIRRVPEPSMSVLSPAYQANSWMLPPQNKVNLKTDTQEE